MKGVMQHSSQSRTVLTIFPFKPMKSVATPFVLNHSSLEKIFSSFHVHPQGLPQNPRNRDLILFAFRGCLPTETLKGWATKVNLELISVDHLHMRCTLGIWDPTNQRIFVAPGSTIPHKSQADLSAARKGKLRGKGSNQMEPGYYTDLTKGEHLLGKPNGHQALRQTANRFYRRSLVGLPYTEKSPLYFGNPYDNLHCGWNLDGVEEGYSSAGCLVVAGIPHCSSQPSSQENQGPWKIFHDLLYMAKQKTFPLLLLPWAIALAALETTAPKMGGLKRNLVFGSSGQTVKDLQKILSEKSIYLGRINGQMDARTYRAWQAVRL
jgi:hypothetical protein